MNKILYFKLKRKLKVDDIIIKKILKDLQLKFNISDDSSALEIESKINENAYCQFINDCMNKKVL